MRLFKTSKKEQTFIWWGSKNQRFKSCIWWAIAKVITWCLNLVVIACVIKQAQGHWLLSNALAIVINLIMAMDAKKNPIADGSETFDQFDI